MKRNGGFQSYQEARSTTEEGQVRMTGHQMTGQETELVKNLISPKRGQWEADHKKRPGEQEKKVKTEYRDSGEFSDLGLLTDLMFLLFLS